jgi:hypothetical protein
MPLSSVDPINSAQGSFGKQLGVGTPPCWSGGGGTGSSGGAHKTYTYRADVLRFLAWDETTGKLAVNGAHEIQLPDGGDVAALGASLVVVYSAPEKPFSAIVLYDGAYTMDQSTEGMFQSIRWFYDGTTSARLTHIVGSGQANKSEILRFNGNKIAANPFTSAQGPGWDNATYVLNASDFVPPVPDPLAQVATSVDHQGFSSFDCLTWAAVVYETPVVDTDKDGLLDVWEKRRPAGSTYPDTDPYGQTLPNLEAMGADPFCKDVFLEINYVKTDVVTSYGGVLKPAHTHLPPHEALKLMGDAFSNAAVDSGPGCTRDIGQGPGRGILLHVDVGNDYPAGSPGDPSKNAEKYIIRNSGGLRSVLARGGEFIDEAATTLDPVTNQPCATTNPPEACQFSAYPGTIGWKTGFRFFRDELVSAQPPPLTATGDDPCDWSYDPDTGQPDTGPGGACERRFDRVRKNMFHYALFAHAIGLPKSEIPSDPAFRIPQTISGVGDLPGGDFMVALGAFSDHLGDYVGDPAVWTAFPTGTPFMVASTAFHEMGHGFGLGHGGPLSDANCKPVYTSAMNYLYQLRGLLDDRGKRNLNFSYGENPPISEEALADNTFPSVKLSYRIGWYAPLSGSYLESSVPTPIPASSRCPGAPREPGEAFIRFDAPDTLSLIDWNANGTIQSGYSLDVNFDGRTTPPPGGTSGQLHQDFDDWFNIQLNQLGSRRSAGGLFRLLPKPADCLDDPCLVLGPLSLDASANDYPASDYAQYDYGRSYYGRSYYGRSYYGADLSRGDLGLGDYGRSYYGRSYYGRSYYGRSYHGRSYYGRSYYGRSYYGASYDDQPFTGSGDRGRSYLGGGDLSLGDPNNPGGELGHETATWNSPPAEFGACVIGVDSSCLGDPDDSFKVRGFWTDPTEGGVRFYQLYRVQATALQAGQEWEPVGAPRDPRVPTLWVDCSAVGRFDANDPSRRCYGVIDDFPLVKGSSYIYFVQATFDDGLTGALSDQVTIVGPNHPPVADAQTVTTAEDTPTLITLTGSDADGDTLTFAFTQPAHGTLSGTGPTLTYAPALNYNGPDRFTFTVDDGTLTSAATVTITVTAVNDAPVAVGDTYAVARDAVLTVAAKGVLANDADVDGGPLSALLVTGPSHAASFALNSDGSFSYTPAADYLGPDGFTYTANDGRLDSTVATVAITVKTYQLIGTQNVPPAVISKAKAGSTVPMKWVFRDGSTVVDSAQVTYIIRMVGTTKSVAFTNTDPGTSSFRYDATSRTWCFNLQTKDSAGVVYPVDTYAITITPLPSGYLPPLTSPFSLTLTK